MAICTVMVIFSGCDSSSDDTRINFPLDSDPKYLDPQIASGYSAQLVVANCFEGLIRYNKDGELRPAVAESYYISSDGKLYTFKLRTNAKWQLTEDFEELFGEGYEKSFNNSVTAHDFVFAMQRAVSPEINSPRVSSLYPIKNAKDISLGNKPVDQLGVVAKDDYTLQITLERPSPDFLPSLTDSVFMPCNKKFYEATKGRYGTDVEFLLCNAPMHLSAWDDDGTYLILEKSKDYKGESKAAASSLGFYVNTDAESKLMKLNDDTYCASPIDSSFIDGVAKDCSLKVFENSIYSLVFNCENEIFSNLNLRLAFCNGIKLQNDSKPAGFIPKSCTIGEKLYRELAGSAHTVAYNDINAKDYFEKGFAELKNPPENITLLCTAETEALAKSLLPDWQKLFGYRLIVKIEVAESIEERLKDGDYTFAITSVSSDNETAVGFVSRFGSENEKNIAKYKSQNLNTVINQLQLSRSQADLTAGCKQAEEHLMQNGVVYPLASKKSYLAVNKNYEDICIFPSGENICFVK